MTMTKIYIVSELHFEYNDEYYYFEGGYTPLIAFRDNESAQKMVNELSIKRMRNLSDISSYEDLTRRMFKLKESLQLELFGKVMENYYDNVSILESASDKTILEFLELTQHQFYRVHEIELHTKKSKTRKIKSV